MTLLPKLIIFGLDSVLLPPRTSLSGDVHLYQPTVEKIALLKSQGVIVTVATGRGITRLSEVVDTLLPNTAVICEDVKLYNYQDKTLISTECFQPEEIDQIGSIIQSGVVEFCGFCPEGDSKYIFWFSDTAQEEKITQVLGSIIKKSTYDIDVFVDLAKKEKAAHIPMKVSQSPSMPDGLNWKYNPSLQMVDIDPSVCESGYGLRKICEFVGVGLSDTLVFISDQDNQAMILNDQNVGLLIQVGEAAGPNVYPSLKINDYQSVPQILDIIFG